MKKFIYVNVLECEMKMVLSNTAIETCPQFDFQESDEEFALRNLKFFLEEIDADLLDDVKMGQRIVVDSSTLAAEIIFQQNQEILVTKFIEKNKIKKYVNKYETTVFAKTSNEL